MTVIVVLDGRAGAGDGRPLQHMEEVATTAVVLLVVLDLMGCWRRGGDGACALQDGEEAGATSVPFFRRATGSCRRRNRRRRRHHPLQIAVTSCTIGCSIKVKVI